MKKRIKGFTLIEIIVCIIIMTIIGTGSTVGITYVKNKNEIKEYHNVNKKLLNALEVYLAQNEEIEKNIMLNTKAAVVTLDVLKNEGLIEDNIYNPTTKEKFDYKKSYFTLLEGTVTPENTTNPYECINNMVGIDVITSWDLNNIDSSDIVYICPRKDWTNEIENLQNSVNTIGTDIDSIKNRLDSVEASLNNIGSSEDESTKDKLKKSAIFEDLTYTAKGINPNNYVEFEVISNSSNVSYFPNIPDKNLWRILSIDGEGKIKLIYPNAVKSNNSKNYNLSKSSVCCTYSVTDESTCTYYELKNPIEGSGYYRYATEDGYATKEIFDEVTVSNSKKKALFDNIVNNAWIVKDKYYPYYTINVGTSDFTDLKLDNSKYEELKMGMLNPTEITASVNATNSWLYSYNTAIGWLEKRPSGLGSEMYYMSATLNNGILNHTYNRKYHNSYKNRKGGKSYDCDEWMLSTYNYYPVITLDSAVELVEPTCASGDKTGSKNCPYKLTKN